MTCTQGISEIALVVQVFRISRAEFGCVGLGESPLRREVREAAHSELT